MKKNSILKLLSAVVTTGLIAAASAFPALAGTTYKPVEGTSTTFKKYLVMDKDATVPNVSFSFSIAAGTAIDAGNGTMAVLPGVMVAASGDQAAKPSIADVSFATSDAVSSQKASEDISVDFDENTQKYAKQTATVDFSGVQFDEPGIYRYVITETQGTDNGITYDDSTKYLDVYVVDTGAVDSETNKPTLAVSSYVLHTDPAAPAANSTNGSADVSQAGAALTDKSDGFQNEYATHNLYFGKVVTGNQASKDKYFRIRVQISGLKENDVITVVQDGCDATSGSNSATKSEYRGQANAATLTADENGAIDTYFYLQHYQYVKLLGLPEGASYTVSEDVEDYKQTASIIADNSMLDWNSESSGNDAMSDNPQGTVGQTDLHIGFTNTKEGIIPTGVLLKVTPVIVIGLLVVAGVVFFAVRSAKSKASEDEAETVEE